MQIDVLKTFMDNVRRQIGLCETTVQGKFLSWEREIQDEIGKLCSLLWVLKDWNACFLSLWNKYQNDIISKIQAYCDGFVSTSRNSLSNMRKTSKDDLQTFSSIFEKHAQSFKEMCQNELMIVFKSWRKAVKALVNSWLVPVKIPHYDHILKSLVSEVKDNLPRLKQICKSDQNLESWYTNLTNMQASWQRQIADTVDHPTEIKRLAQTWQLNLEECPSYQQEQLKTFFLSEPVQHTLTSMRKNKILTDDQFRKVTLSTTILDLRALDTICLLILLRTNVFLQPPELGWQADTSDTDLSAGADLLRLESYIYDLIRDIRNPSIPKERFQQLEDVLNRLASHGSNEFQIKIKTDMVNIKACVVEEPLEGQFDRFVINLCRRAIWVDSSGLSLSGRSKLKSYIEILRSLLYKDYESIDVGTSEPSCKDSRDMDQRVPDAAGTHPDFDEHLASTNIEIDDVSQSKEINIVSQEAKRNREEKREETVRKRLKQSHHYAAGVTTTSSSSTSVGIYDEENVPGESCVASTVYSTTADLVSEKGTKVLELLKNDDYTSIDDLLKEGQIPTKMTTITAVKAFGYKKSVKHFLSGISDLLKEAIPNSTRVWCGYKPQEPNCPVFVVTLRDRNCIFDMDQIPEPFKEYEPIVRRKHVPSEEERNILIKSGRKIVRTEDTAKIHKCIAENINNLMFEHSNLSIIRASSVKASGYLNNKLVLADKTCLVLSVPVKGIIPIGEKEFRKSIDGIVTDVREGEFVLFGRHNANEYHSRLRMGCCVSRPETGLCGTLGGFVDLPGNKVGCLTAAHVVLTEDEIQEYIGMDEQMRKSSNENLKAWTVMKEIYQPQHNPNSIPFGTVHTLALQEGNIYSSPSLDAAIIEINDYNRNPKAGNFPDGDFGDVGFTTDNPLLYTTGEILDQIPPNQKDSKVIKFGTETGITSGFLGWDETSARVISESGNYCFPTMHRQIEIIPTDLRSANTCDEMEITATDFASKGDSGALAFLSLNDDVNNLYAIGMVIGGNSTNCLTLITPITAIFQELALPQKKFKVFPNVPRLLEEHSLKLNTISGNMNTMSTNMNTMSTRMDTMSTNINTMSTGIETILENIKRMEQKIETSVREEIKKGLKEFTSGNGNVNT